MTPIHVAIPSYNNADGLRRLLPQVCTQNFASVIVMDDGSTDDTVAVMAEFPQVHHLTSECNNGPVAAKNMILERMPTDGFVLFIDSDMQLITTDMPEQLQSFTAEHPDCGAGVGVIRNTAGGVHAYNRGYDLQPLRMVLAAILHSLHRLCGFSSGLQSLVKKISTPWTYAFAPAVVHKADWVVEGFCFVRSDLFQAEGGYDARMYRFHEGPDLCLRLRKRGYSVWFCPQIEIQDFDQHTGTSWSRFYHWWRSLGIYFYKHPSRLLLYRFPRP